MNLTNLRCPSCASPRLMSAGAASSTVDVEQGAICCESCGATYDTIANIPYLGHFEKEDTLGLIEIAANAREDNGYSDRSDIDRIERLLAAYHIASDKSRFTREHPDEYARAFWFKHRYTEYAQFCELTGDISFTCADVLDVGAGAGYGTSRLVGLGARVTALEYNPELARIGRQVVPEARWICGFSHVLPFETGSFDFVYCNAALHHMRDVPQTIREMLRVLRPGGRLLTTGDPFRSATTPASLEFDIFDTAEAVLLGVNESIPSITDMTGPLLELGSKLSVDLYTSVLYDAVLEPGSLPRTITDLHKWGIADLQILHASAGTIAIRVTTNGDLGLPAACQSDYALRAGAYGKVLRTYEHAIQTLAPLVPQIWVDLPLAGGAQTKFEMLNGWRQRQPRADYRTGYRRARWYLTRLNSSEVVAFEVRRSKSGALPAAFSVLINGVPASDPIILKEKSWRGVKIFLPQAIANGDRFVCELRLEPLDGAAFAFEDYQFDVRARTFDVTESKLGRESQRQWYRRLYFWRWV